MWLVVLQVSPTVDSLILRDLKRVHEVREANQSYQAGAWSSIDTRVQRQSDSTVSRRPQLGVVRTLTGLERDTQAVPLEVRASEPRSSDCWIVVGFRTVNAMLGVHVDCSQKSDARGPSTGVAGAGLSEAKEAPACSGFVELKKNASGWPGLERTK